MMLSALICYCLSVASFLAGVSVFFPFGPGAHVIFVHPSSLRQLERMSLPSFLLVCRL